MHCAKRLHSARVELTQKQTFLKMDLIFDWKDLWDGCKNVDLSGKIASD